MREGTFQSESARRGSLPDGVSIVDLSPGGGAAPLRLGLLARKGKAGRDISLLTLEGSFDSRVFLGCEMDAAGRVQRWLEVHVQDLEGVHAAPAAFRDGLSNSVFDDRWRRLAAGAESALPADRVIVTGWERSHLLPLLVDPAMMTSANPVDEHGHAWRVCVDDALLSGKGLPPYSTSLHRYLHVSESARSSGFVPLTPGAPVNEHTKSIDSLLGGKSGQVPLLVSGGLAMVRVRCPVGYEEFVDLLGEEPASAVLKLDPLSGVGSGGTHYRPFVEGGLLLPRHGQWGRLVEALHLKLRLLADAIAGVRGVVAETRAPFLNLSATSFRVDLGPAGIELPALWTARAVLVRAGDAMALPIPGADAEYFIQPRATASIYAPDSAGRAVEGRAQVRVRKVTPDKRPGIAVVSGSFVTQERISPRASDLTWIRLHIGDHPVDLYARLESQSGGAAGEWRFTTVPQSFGAGTISTLQSAEGVAAADAPFQTIPLLSTPCDLYALGVLAIRTLLVGGGEPEITLPEALDELMSLARASSESSGDGLAARLAATMPREARWMNALGPHRLVRGLSSREAALDVVPMDLWCDTLAMIIRMFPALSDESTCGDLGDAPAAGIHSVFDAAIKDVERLLVRSRSLIVIDWRQNREIHSVVRRHRTGLAGTGGEARIKAKS